MLHARALGALLAALALFVGSGSSDVCISSGCRKATGDILSFIEPSVDPCKDMYKFTCSGIFKKTHEGKPVSLRAIVAKEVGDQLSSVLKKPSHSSDPRAVQALKRFFRLCTNESAVEKGAVRSLRMLLHKVGGWPAVEGPRWNEENFGVQKLLIDLRRAGMEFKQLFYFGTSINLRVPSLVLTEPYVPYIDDQDVENYYELMLNVAIALGAVKEVASQDLQEALQLRIKFRNVLDNADQCRISSVHSIQEEFPLFDWLEFINAVVHPNKNVTSFDKLYFPSRKYLHQLSILLSETSNRTLANFIIWQAVQDLIPYLPKQFADLRDEFVPDPNRPVYTSRVDFCRDQAETILPPTFEAFYVHQHFHSNKRHKAQEMVRYIKEEFIRLLETTKLFDDDTRTRMLQKAHNVTFYTGAPEKMFDDTIFLDLFDKSENLTTDDFLTMATLLKRQAANLAVKVKNVNDYYNVFYEETVNVDAFYDPQSNTLSLPAALFQGLYFSENRPQFMNFGAAGTTVASQLLHGFTKRGSEFSRNEIEDFSWSNGTLVNYEERSQCLINEANAFPVEDSSLPLMEMDALFYGCIRKDFQRGEYQITKCWLMCIRTCVNVDPSEFLCISYGITDLEEGLLNAVDRNPGTSLNGAQILDETVCDLTGVEIAYRAYQSWVSAHGEEKLLPGLDYSPLQMFWIAAASTFCDTVSLDLLQEFITEESVGHPTYRLASALSNNKNLGKDFHCPVATRMNPSMKCQIF